LSNKMIGSYWNESDVYEILISISYDMYM
jgi:hypothetical protein